MKQESPIPFLKRVFFIAFGLQVMLFIAVAFKQINIMSDTGKVSFTLERYVLLLTLGGIFGALKLFSMIMEKNKHPEDNNVKKKLYIKAFLVRFSILFFIASLNILLYALSYRQNFMLLTLVTFTAYLFSYPSQNYLSKKEV